MEHKKNPVNEQAVNYGIAVASIIIAAGLGAFALGGALARLAGFSVSLPSVFGVLGSGSYADLVGAGALAIFAALVGQYFVKKSHVRKSDKADANEYCDLINRITKAFCYITAIAAGVAAAGSLVATMLSVSNATNWGNLFLGQILPLLLIGGGIFGAGMLIEKMAEAKIKANVVSTIVISVAGAALGLAAIVVLIKSHTTTAPTTNTYQNVIRSLYR